MESSPSQSSPSTPSSSSQASPSSATSALASSLASLVKVEGGSSVGGGPSGTGSGGCASEEWDEWLWTLEQEQDDGQLGQGHASSTMMTTDDLGGGSSSVNGAGEPGRGMHPLLDQVILGNLFKFSPPRALATSRLVCLTWRDLSLPTWRSNSTVRIYNLSHGNKPDYFLRGIDGTSLEDFMDFWGANCRIKPYRQFHLERWSFQEGTVGAGVGFTSDVARFWQGVGSQMTKLRMDNCNTTKLEHFMNVIIHSCPNLKTLILQEFTVGNMFLNRYAEAAVDAAADNDDDEEDRVPVANPNPNPVSEEHLNLKSLQLIYTPDNRWQEFLILRVNYTELLSHFPRLTSITLCTEPDRQHSEVLELLNAVKEVREHGPQKLPLEELVTDSPLEFRSELVPNDEGDDQEEHEPRYRPGMVMQLLLELRIPAHSIRLTANLSLNEIQNVIQSNSERLAELVVFFYSSPRFDFPFGIYLENLRQLTMSEGFCKTLDLLMYTPNLETLSIQDDANPLPLQEEDVPERPRGMETDLISNIFKPDLEDLQLLKLSELTIQFYVRDYDLRWLVRWMPNVRNLCMFLDDRQFAIVCENWGELVELSVLGYRLTDEGVTGMMEIRRCGIGSKKIVVHPNVTDLKKLEVFTARGSTLSNASLYHGFLKLDHLRRISFQMDGKIEVAAKEALLQKNIQRFSYC